ncbi:MAG TPA: hypothetical protein VF557_07770 [Jatrophihabitans sp.]|uniref:hypothetical protein n=1 Tax=Jatrophihabitans sp. TaxID=1932789 RepID=UPI002F03AFA2
MASRHQFTDAQVDQAIAYLIEQAAEDRAETRSYTLVFRAGGLDAPQDMYKDGAEQAVSKFMEAIHWRCNRNADLPPLDSLVVYVAGPRMGHPGPGYFRVNNHSDPFDVRTRPEAIEPAMAFWRAEVAQCKAWGIRSRRERA